MGQENIYLRVKKEREEGKNDGEGNENEKELLKKKTNEVIEEFKAKETFKDVNIEFAGKDKENNTYVFIVDGNKFLETDTLELADLEDKYVAMILGSEGVREQEIEQ